MNAGSSNGIGDESIAKQPKMFLLWKRAIDSHKALLLDENTELTPDSLLGRVEEFHSLLQAAEHSYPALLLCRGDGAENVESSDDGNDEFSDRDRNSEDFEDCEIDISDSFEEVDPLAPYGSLPVDSIAERLSTE